MKKAIGTCLLIVFSFYVQSQETINVGGDEWEGYSHPDGTGVYFELVSEIYSDYKLNFHVDSYNRSLNNFDQQKIDIFVGAFREDLPQALLPHWHLDIDYPITAFTLDKGQKTTEVMDLETLQLSWLRGYHFERYLADIKTPYLVNSIANGFELLERGRIDSFIDYEYNVPTKLKGKLNQTQVMPSRHIYLAFQNTKHGQKLANFFDSQMQRLQQSGKLEKMYKEDYEHAQFAQFNSDKKKIIIYTDEPNLVKAHKETTLEYASTLNHIYSLIFDQLEDYAIEFRIVRDFSKIDILDQDDNICFSDKLKTPERMNKFFFSEPLSLYLGLRLYSAKKISSDQSINIKKYIAENSATLGRVKGRSYGAELDRQFDSLDNKKQTLISTDISLAMKMLSKKRFDLIVEYPREAHFYWPQYSNAPLYSYAINNAPEYNLGHLMCHKSTIGQNFINRFNVALAGIKGSSAFYRSLSSNLDKDSKALFQQYFHEVFEK